MADLIITEKQDLLNIANAIREKLGTVDKMSVYNMPSLISNISGSGSSAGNGTTGDSTSTVEPSLISTNSRVVVEFNGTLNDMNNNEEYPSTEWFGMNFSGIKLTYGKDYLVEYNGASYWIKPSFTPLLSLAGSGMGSVMGWSPTDFLTLGSTTMLDEFIARQKAEPPEDGEEDILSGLGGLLGIIMAIALGYPIDFDSLSAIQYPFSFINFGDYGDAIGEGEYDTIFIVNNGESECTLKITEYNMNVENPLNEYLQPDYLQLDKNHPAYIKNKLAGIESTDKLFFDGKVSDLSLSPITDSDGDTTGYVAPLNEIPMGTEFIGALFGSALSGNSSTMPSDTSMFMSLLFDRCIIVKYNGVEQVLYPMDMKNMFGITESDLENMTEEEMEEFMSIFSDGNGNFAYPFGNLSILEEGLPNTGENFCILTAFVSGSENGDSATPDEKPNMLDALNQYVVVKGIAYTNLKTALPEHKIRVEYAKLKVLDKKYLPTIVESDLPEEALTYTTAKDNVMLKDQVNGYEYLVLCKNGVLSTLCRCASIAITTNPSKTSYRKGESFNPAGMTVIATRQDGSTENVTSKITYDTSEFTSTSSEKKMTITFKEAGHAYEATVTITVTE